MSGVIYKPKDKPALLNHFTAIEWQWFFSGCLEPDTPRAKAERVFAGWRQEVAKQTGLQVCTMGVFSAVKGHHLHVLMAGEDRRGRTLLDISRTKRIILELDWEGLTHRTAVIDVVTSEGAGQYVTNHFIFNPTAEHVCVHNIKLLKRLKERETP